MECSLSFASWRRRKSSCALQTASDWAQRLCHAPCSVVGLVLCLCSLFRFTFSSSLASEFCLTTQHLLGRGGGPGGGSDTHPPTAPGTPPPLLSDWAKFSPGLQQIKNFLWRPSVQVSLGHKISSAPSVPLTTQGLRGGVPPTAPPQPPPLDPPPLKENSAWPSFLSFSLQCARMPGSSSSMCSKPPPHDRPSSTARHPMTAAGVPRWLQGAVCLRVGPLGRMP